MSSFEKRPEGPVYAVKVVQPSGPKPLIVSFGAMAPKPIYSFVNITASIVAVNKIFVRDMNMMFYQKGLDSNINTVTKSVEYLREIIDEMEPSKTIFFGNSAGAYAAILFGAHLDADEVHAFAPLTDLLVDRYIGHRSQQKEMLKVAPTDHLDLLDVLSNLSYKSTINIYFDETYRKDRYHAERLQKLPGICLQRGNEGKHNLVKVLNNSGQLKKIILESLN